MDIAIAVDAAGVARVKPAAMEAVQIAPIEAVVVVPEGAKSGGREGQGEDDVAHGAKGQLVACIVDDTHVEAGHRLSGAPGADRGRLSDDSGGRWHEVGVDGGTGGEGAAGDGRAGLGRPPVVDDLG